MLPRGGLASSGKEGSREPQGGTGLRQGQGVSSLDGVRAYYLPLFLYFILLFLYYPTAKIDFFPLVFSYVSFNTHVVKDSLHN